MITPYFEYTFGVDLDGNVCYVDDATADVLGMSKKDAMHLVATAGFGPVYVMEEDELNS